MAEEWLRTETAKSQNPISNLDLSSASRMGALPPETQTIVDRISSNGSSTAHLSYARSQEVSDLLLEADCASLDFLVNLSLPSLSFSARMHLVHSLLF